MRTLLAMLLCFVTVPAFAADNDSHWLSVQAKDKVARTRLVNLGMSIESVVDDMAYGFAPLSIIKKMEKAGVQVSAHFPVSEFKTTDFPAEDSLFHNYSEMTAEIDSLVSRFPNLVHAFSVGTTGEGRQMWAMRLNPTVKDAKEASGLPGVAFMGGHHAREHVSMEMPILYAKHLAENYGKDETITRLLDTRDIYFIPMVNPDGSEYDIASGSYRMWRKNRRINGGSCAGVDINRNYGFKWGTGGSSTDKCSDVYMGAAPFSEPESQSIKSFVESKPNLKVLLSFHTYSELVLYPWGNTYDPISNTADLSTFKKMADTMAGWNGYTAEQTSDLYIASGDTTDWAYGALGIFAFTFELSPKDAWGGGGFYPGAGAIERTFQANLKPVMYLIDLADDPHRAVRRPETTLFYGR